MEDYPKNFKLKDDTKVVLRIMTEDKEEGIACSVAKSLADQLRVVLNN